MKFLSIVFLILSVVVTVGFIGRLLQGDSIAFIRAFIGMTWIFVITVTCTWCWKKHYKAPWILLSGVLTMLAGLGVLGAVYENFDQIKDTWFIDITIFILLLSIGLSIVLFSRKLHCRR